MTACNTILRNLTILNKKGLTEPSKAIVIAAGKIIWIGEDAQLPLDFSADEILDCQDQLITPGLIDCHTHLVYAGNRAHEYKLRLQGATYAEIAKAGGGILSTVQQTRAASEEALFEQSLPRILALKKEGVSTVEIKSGYGLDLENELKMLKVARKLGENAGIRVKTTFLGAHAVPPEYRGNSQKYVDLLCQEMLPKVAESKLADAVDVFCENIAFSLDQTQQIFAAAKNLGFGLKCHAGQLSDMGACNLAADFGALSCDHLEYLDEKGAQAMAQANMVAVLLPGAWYFLKEKKSPPIELLREAGVGMAIATDCNPGSSPTTALLLMANMACQFFGFTIPEALAGMSWQAARALGVQDQTGSLELGKAADLILWNLDESDSLCYYFGYPLARKLMVAGVWV